MCIGSLNNTIKDTSQYRRDTTPSISISISISIIMSISISISITVSVSYVRGAPMAPVSPRPWADCRCDNPSHGVRVWIARDEPSLTELFHWKIERKQSQENKAERGCFGITQMYFPNCSKLNSGENNRTKSLIRPMRSFGMKIFSWNKVSELSGWTYCLICSVPPRSSCKHMPPRRPLECSIAGHNCTIVGKVALVSSSQMQTP